MTRLYSTDRYIKLEFEIKTNKTSYIDKEIKQKFIFRLKLN